MQVTALGTGLAVAVGAVLLLMARRPPVLGRLTRLRALAARGLQLLYLVAGASLLVRAAFSFAAL